MFIQNKKIGVTCVMGALLLSLGLGGCQKQDESANSTSDTSVEEAQPMSAEPAETEEALVLDNTQSTDDTLAAETTEDIIPENIVDVSYNCTPALEVHANYNMVENNVVLDINENSMVLSISNLGETPLIYTNEQGETQWRVTQSAQDDMGQAVLRINEGDAVQSYECSIAS